MRELVGRRAANIRLIPLDLVTWRRQRIIRREGALGSAEQSAGESAGEKEPDDGHEGSEQERGGR
jgi:hypothetical protein